MNENVTDFSLPDQNGNIFNLYENLDSYVLLIFYPKDDSLVCSRQLSDYNLNKKEFEKYGIKLVGVNPGGKESHKNFCGKLELHFPVLSDTDKEISKRFNAVNSLGILKRKLVLISRDKKVIFEKSTMPFYYLSTAKILEALKAAKVIKMT